MPYIYSDMQTLKFLEFPMDISMFNRFNPKLNTEYVSDNVLYFINQP